MLKMDKREMYAIWIAELESGKLPQTKGRLCKQNDEGKSYCCLGVAVEKVFELDWKVAEPEYDYHTLGYSSRDREYFPHTTNLGWDEKRMLGLDKLLTVKDLTTLLTISFGDTNYNLASAPTHREGALAFMNDKGVSFEKIAEFLKEVQWWKE